MAAAGVTTFIEVGPGRVLTGLIKRIAPDAEAIALDDPGRRRSALRPLRVADSSLSLLERDPPNVRKPDYDRRVVVTGLGVVSPVGNDVQTAWDNLIRGNSGLAEITKFDVSRYEAKAAGEVRDFNAVALDGPEGRSAAARRACTSACPPRSRR